MRGALRALSAWGRIVVASALVVGVGAAAVAVSWATSRETRVASSAVRGDVQGVVLDAGDGDVEVVGGREGATGVVVRRRERSAFGNRPAVRRELVGGVLRLGGRCPAGVLSTCDADWRIEVPENVPVEVRTHDGDVALRNFLGPAKLRSDSGDVAVAAFCGFSLDARTETGDVRADATCPGERLVLRSRTGSVRASVPAGRYRLDVDSTSGAEAVHGVTAADDAPFELQALSDRGDVVVEGTQ